ncbi:hypothetical protein [Metabacillus niabensis]
MTWQVFTPRMQSPTIRKQALHDEIYQKTIIKSNKVYGNGL